MSEGDTTHPQMLLITTAVLLVIMALPSIKKARQEAFQEEG